MKTQMGNQWKNMRIRPIFTKEYPIYNLLYMYKLSIEQMHCWYEDEPSYCDTFQYIKGLYYEYHVPHSLSGQRIFCRYTSIVVFTNVKFGILSFIRCRTGINQRIYLGAKL